MVRQHWTKQQDKELKNQINSEKRQIIWNVISHKLKQMGIKKTAKQCRERWTQNLAPSVKKQKWSNLQNSKLFELFRKKGNKWKSIATFFDGKTDNSVKNKFFSLIRKSLRLICKILKMKKNTEKINIFTGKFLSEFMKQDFFLDFESVEEIEGAPKFFFDNFKEKDFFDYFEEFVHAMDRGENGTKFGGFFRERKHNEGYALDLKKNINKNTEFYNKNINFKKNTFEKMDFIKEKNILNEKSKSKNFNEIFQNQNRIKNKNKDTIKIKKKKKVYLIQIDKLIEKIAFSKYDEINKIINTKDKFILQKIFDKLNLLNKQNSSQKKKKLKEIEKIINLNKNLLNSKKNTNLITSNLNQNFKISENNEILLNSINENIPNFRISETNKNLLNNIKTKSLNNSEIYLPIDLKSKLRKNRNTSRNLYFSEFSNSKKKEIKKIKKIKKKANLNSYSKKIYNLMKKEKQIIKDNQNNLLNLKMELVKNFKQIKNCAEIFLSKIPKSSEMEIKNYSLVTDYDFENVLNKKKEEKKNDIILNNFDHFLNKINEDDLKNIKIEEDFLNKKNNLKEENLEKLTQEKNHLMMEEDIIFKGFDLNLEKKYSNFFEKQRTFENLLKSKISSNSNYDELCLSKLNYNF